MVEDNPDDELLTLRALKNNNISNEVIVARDGQQALDYFFGEGAADRITPTVMLLDLKLPKVDGLEVLRRIRADERTHMQPIVILTSSKEEQDLFTSYRLGVNSYIRKPVDFSQFLEAIRQFGLYWLVLNETPPSKGSPLSMKLLRALIVEDSEDDVELLLQELRRGGYSPDHTRVDTPETMSAELKKGNWDIVYADFTMPRFNAFAALALLHDTGLDIPFIIVSGTIGEDRAVTAMKAGAHDYILKGNMKRLVPATERELRDMLVRRERKEANETIYRFAYTDSITDLPNRILFHEKVEKAVKDTKRDQHSMALLLMDLDRFKDVNDTLGHDQGDALLKQIGQRLQNVLVAPNIVARIGGDEFGILLPRIAAADDVKHIIKKLLDTLKAPFIINKIPIVAEVSIGVAMMPEHAKDADKLLQMADIAMYHAKNMADDYAFYEASYNLNSPERLGLMSELRDAIEQNQLVLHYQPKVETKTNRIVGVEALVRWQHPRLGLLYPDKFIMVAETTGLITPLTKWVLAEALHYCKKQSNEGNHLRVSVNLSARSLHDSQLLKMVADALEITGVDPSQLMLEITESSIVLDPKRAEREP